MNKFLAKVRKFFSRRLRAIIIAVAVLTIGFLIFRARTSNPQQTTVQTQKVERGTIISSVSASGQMLASNIINVTSNATGMVKSVYAKDGDKISSGQKILEITLDSSGQQAASSAYSSYISAKNNLDSAQVSLYTLDSAMWAANRAFVNDALARGLLTYDPTYIQESDNWLAAEARYINQKNIIAQAQMAVNNAWLSYQAVAAIVYAPTAGIVNSITYSSGMAISGSASRVAVIKSSGMPLATFNISEIDVSKVKPGQKVTIKLDSLTDKTFSGKVLVVDRIGTITSGVTNYPVVIGFDTDSPDVLPNMSATATIILDFKDNVLLVPSTAIQVQNDQSIVRVVKDKKEQPVVVGTGLVSDTQTEIISGLSEGDEIVVLATTTSASSSQNGNRSVFSTGGLGGGAGRFIGR